MNYESINQYINSSPTGNFFLLAGPCVIEGEEMALDIAERVLSLTSALGIPYVFKGSYRKANRSRIDSFTGIGDIKALGILKKVRDTFHIPVVTDIHTAEEAEMAAEYVDILQIPAFLCRQTDLLVAITERGTTFGYQDLIVDYRGIPEMQKNGCPVILDVTHSLQQPNQTAGVTGGRPDMIETIARAGIAVGVDGIFIETHQNPSVAKSDGANMLPLDQMGKLLSHLTLIRAATNSIATTGLQ